MTSLRSPVRRLFAYAAALPVLLVLSAAPALAQSFSSVTHTNLSSGNEFNDPAILGVSYERKSTTTASSTALPGGGAQIDATYKYMIAADAAPFNGDRTEVISNSWRFNFNVTAPGTYLLNVTTAWRGGMTTLSDGGGEASADVGALTGGFTGGTLQSGSLSFGDPGRRNNTGSSGETAWDLSGAASILGTSNGVAQAHQLSFSWSSNCTTNSTGFLNGNGGDECAVRSGIAGSLGNGVSVENYPGSPSRTLATDGHFVTVVLVSLCGNSIINASEQCDLGDANGAATSCCTSSCQRRSAGQVCRVGSGNPNGGSVCDPQEVCSGSSDSCPADVKSSAGTVCRASPGNPNGGLVCDTAETCSGVSAAPCPADVFSSGATVCRAGSGNPNGGSVCDPTEMCPGSAGGVCAADSVSSAGTVCNAGGGNPNGGSVCDPNEVCSGTAGVPCPADTFSSAATVCRAGSGNPNGGLVCDADEFCPGSADTACPADALQSAGAICRAGSGNPNGGSVCDPTETCSGTPGVACAPDSFASAGTVCNAGSGSPNGGTVCDPDEVCAGAPLAACPADSFSSAATVCRAGSGTPNGGLECDQTELCPGTPDAPCAADVVLSAGTVCNAGSGDPNGSGFVCDQNEVCSGTNLDPCPVDTISSAGTVCNAGSGDPNSGGLICDPDETCSGVADDPCDADTISPAGTVCNPGSGDLCDPDETCSGTADDACPVDDFEDASTICNPGSGDPNGSGTICDPDEFCTGNPNDACPTDTISPAGTLCKLGQAECDSSESCSGTADDPCSLDINYPDGTSCYTGNGIPDPHNPPPVDPPLPCNDGECVCAGGRCIGPGQDALVLNRAKMKTSKPTKDTGLAKVEGLVQDEETEPEVFGGDLRQELIAGNVLAAITDGGQFDTEFPLSNCLENATGQIIRCKQGIVTATFRLTNPAPVTYDLTIDLKGLGIGDTNSGPLTPPVTLTLFQNTGFYRVERGGSISQDCVVSGSGRSLKCSEPKE